MLATKLRKNDKVEVVAGKEKGKRGRIIAVLLRKERVLVESLNLMKKHMRASAQSKEGGILEKEGPLHISNVMLVCPKCDKATRLGTSILDGDRKVRVCRRCGESVDK